MKKHLGQNFLQDKNILRKIISAAELTKDDLVLEIGTGAGFMTEELAKSAATVKTVEIDNEKVEHAKKSLDFHTNIEFILGDFLIKAKEIFEGFQDKKVKVIANIPYYITTPIIEKLLFYKEHLEFIEIMIQKEVAQRLMAQPGVKDYSSLTIFVQYHARVEKVCNVSRNCFYPKPAVDSTVIKIIPHKSPPVISEDMLFRIIKAAFWGRRKIMVNCLKNAVYTKFNERVLTKLKERFPKIVTIRGERLSLGEFIEIADYAQELISQ